MTQIPSVPPMAGGWRMEGTDFPSSYPAVPRPPYSLFRHVLQLQVVHLQSSPQMQIPPRREDRATHVRTELEWETQVRCRPSQSQSLWAVPRAVAGQDGEDAAEHHPKWRGPSSGALSRPHPGTGVASASPRILIKTDSWDQPLRYSDS